MLGRKYSPTPSARKDQRSYNFHIRAFHAGATAQSLATTQPVKGLSLVGECFATTPDEAEGDKAADQ